MGEGIIIFMKGRQVEMKKWPEIEKIKPAVKELWYRGNLSLLDKRPKLAIVGSRRMSSYGAMVLEKWMPELVAHGVVIVSGFMYGVDQKAHKTCLDNGGGLFLSEYPGSLEATLYMFPARNRIVAGISDAVLVVEAAEKSGSLITADWAIRLGKPLLALPGNVTSRISKGTNWLVRENKAQMVTGVDDVLSVLGLFGKKDKQLVLSDPILELLQIEPKMIDEIVKITRKSVAEVMGKLSEWELTGGVECRGGRYYIV